jgi:hypothetical protein
MEHHRQQGLKGVCSYCMFGKDPFTDGRTTVLVPICSVRSVKIKEEELDG